ncbi:conserved hypothetical protein [Planktothrix rubescens CCAP 1459/22]|uniref:Uncharacterized protein n=1 Tax=Planktothrix rubescens CCAP 1459/22 TaxID=329571 RepID=A0A6J7ZEJ7_PLARU|nr:conserved hypothetical protein [Planktothrix rubescens NIVA-CYA 18]
MSLKSTHNYLLYGNSALGCSSYCTYIRRFRHSFILIGTHDLSYP